MARGKKLVKDTILYGIANFGSKILAFLMLPLYTHYFTTAEYGTWDLVLTTGTLLAPLITFELVSAVYRWLLETKDENERKRYISSGALIILRNLLLFNVLAITLLFFVTIPYHWQLLLYINVVVLSSFFQQCARGLGYNKLFASLGIIQTVITVATIIYFIFVMHLRLEAFFYSSIIGSMAVIIIAWKTMHFSNYLSVSAYSKRINKMYLTYSLPLIPGAVSWWTMNMADRYFIIYYLGMDYNGIYAVANRIPALLVMISSVFFLAWKDSAIIEFDSAGKNSYYSNVFQYFFRLMATSVIIITLGAKPLLNIAVSEAFYSAWQYVGILLLGTLFSSFSLFWAAGYHGAKKTNVIFITSLAGALINIIINFLLINYIGLYAVVISTFIAFLVTWFIRVFSAEAYFKITINIRDMITLFTLIILANIIPHIVNDTGLFISIACALILFFGYNLEIIKLLFQTLRKFLLKKEVSIYSE